MPPTAWSGASSRHDDIAVSIVALVAIVFAWRGSFPARKVAVAGCLVPALRPAGVLLLPDRRCMP